MFSKKDTNIDEIFTVDLTLYSMCQIDGEDLVNFCGLLRKHELYQSGRKKKTIFYVLINTNFYIRFLNVIMISYSQFWKRVYLKLIWAIFLNFNNYCLDNLWTKMTVCINRRCTSCIR